MVDDGSADQTLTVLPSSLHQRKSRLFHRKIKELLERGIARWD